MASTNDLQTSGSEFFLNGKEYVGFYNINNSTFFTGRAFDSTSRMLEPIPLVVKEYLKISSIRIGDAPSSFYPSPTSSDYNRGWFSRYFVKRANDESAYVSEISKDEFNKFFLRDNNVDWALYIVVELRWKISGNRNDVIDPVTNKIIDTGVFDTNAREINKAELHMRGLSDKLSNLLEFYKLPITSPGAIQRVTDFNNSF